MTFKQAVFLSLCGLAAITLVPTALFSLAALDTDSPHPSDQYLGKTFIAYEADFEKLVRMSNEDSHVIRIAPDFTWLDNNAAWPRPESELGFSKQRWDEYRSLFSKLELKSGVLNYQPDLILFIASSKGLVTGGSSKGYAYSVKDPPLIVESLDNYSFKDSDKDINLAYRKLKGHWYLYYEVSR
jgi:hypothetical protein